MHDMCMRKSAILTLLFLLAFTGPPANAHRSASDQRPGGGEALVTSEGTWITYTPENSGLPGAWVSKIGVDYVHDHVWFVGAGGASRLSRAGKWTTYSMETFGYAQGDITSVAVDAEGNAWLGLYTGSPTQSRPDGGVIKVSPDGTWIDYSSKWPYGIQEISSCRSGSVWLKERSYITRFDGTTWEPYPSLLVWWIIEHHYADISSTVEPRYVKGLWCVDTSSNGIWSLADSIGEGANFYDGTQWINFNETDGLLDNSIQHMAVSADGRKWFATWQGISVLDDRRTSVKSDDRWISYPAIRGNNITSAHDGAIWIATYDERTFWGTGISVWRNSVWKAYDATTSGLPHDSVGDIAVDGYDVKWFATHGGVASFKERNATAEIPELGTLLLVGLGLGALGAYLARRRACNRSRRASGQT